MSGALGGGYSNDGFDLVKPLRKLFDGMDERRREQVRVNTEHSMATQRAAQAHAYNMELFHAQVSENRVDSAISREHEVRMERERGRQARSTVKATAKANAQAARENYDHAATQSGPNKSISAASGGSTLSGSTPPAKRTAAKKAAPAKKATAAKKATKAATPRKPKA